MADSFSVGTFGWSSGVNSLTVGTYGWLSSSAEVATVPAQIKKTSFLTDKLIIEALMSKTILRQVQVASKHILTQSAMTSKVLRVQVKTSQSNEVAITDKQTGEVQV